MLVLLLKRRLVDQLIVSIDVYTNDHRGLTSSPQADREMQPGKNLNFNFYASFSNLLEFEQHLPINVTEGSNFLLSH